MDHQENPYASPHSESQWPPQAEGSPLSSPGLERTATGLGLVYYGILIMLLMIVVGIIAMVLTGDARQALFPVLLIGVGAIVGGLLMFIGQVLCLAVPAESGGRGLIIGTVILQALNFVTSVTMNLVGNGTKSGNLFGLIGAVLFILFLRKVSQYIGRRDLATRAGNVLGIMGAIVGLAMVAGVLAAIKAQAALFVMGAVGLIALVGFVMYVNLLNALRKALRRG
jgi:hypothetical protein